MANKQVRVGKIDLDTCGAAFLLGVTREDEVQVVRGNATSEDLANADIICIEVGGSGEVSQNNWDHHAADGPQESASLQVGQTQTVMCCFCGAYHWGEIQPEDATLECNPMWLVKGEHSVSMLVEYINKLDTQGPEALRSRTGANVKFPTLSDVFAGMLLTERGPVEQLHKGIEILKEVIRTEQDPCGTILGFDAYAEAKAANNAAIAKAVEQAQWTVTQGGRKLAFLETDFFGAPGALYGVGAEIAVAYAPQFGNPPVPKFTVAGNGIKVDMALSALNALEEGWGGPATGTIIGSPRSGSILSLEQVVEIVKQAC